MKLTRPHLRRVMPTVFAAVVTGCRLESTQSAVHPAAEAAREIATLGWIMGGMLAVSFLLVMALVWIAVHRAPSAERNEPAHIRRRTGVLVIAGGIALPGFILVAMLFASLHTALALRKPLEGIRIQVTGHQWWWDVRYPETGIVIANELYLPADEPAVIELRAADVIHSFWVPNLHGKIDLLPETVTRIVLEPGKPGEWRGQCAEFCGRQHAWMALKVIALPRPEFDAWIEARRSPPPPPPSPDSRRARGEAVFFRESCHVCHTIEGTRAVGKVGPDLTHLNSRLTLGAGRVPHTEDNLARWIIDPQSLKPGNLMPATPLVADDLTALIGYLRSVP